MSMFTRNGPRVSDNPDPDHLDDEKTVAINRRRFTRRQWTRRWLAWRRVVLPALLLVAVGVGVWLVFFSSVLAVSGVQVVGTRLLDPSVVRRDAAVPTGGPLATVDLEAISRRLDRIPAIKSVDVSRSWPDSVRIQVTERRAVAVVETSAGGGLQGMDATGTLFRHYKTRPARLPIIKSGVGTGIEARAEAGAVAGSLPPAIAAKVADISVRTVDAISLDLRDGRTVLWGSGSSDRVKAQVLTVLLRQKARHYDVSVPGQPVIRP